MPEFSLSLPGVFVAGNAGDGGVVSSNDGRVVIGPNAGNAHFLNGVEVVCQSYGPHPPKLVAVNVLTGASRDLLLDGVNKIVAGADHWFAVTMHNGALMDGAPIYISVRAFAGPYMAWFPWNGTGLYRRGPDGAQSTLSTTLGPEDPIQLFPDGGVVWAEGGKVHSYSISDFPASPLVLSGGFGWVKAFRVGSVWWLAYQSYALACVVAHPATELIGYSWPAPNAFRLDVTVIAGRPRLVWSRSDADSPADIQLRDIDLSFARDDLASLLPGQPPPPPNPVEKPPVLTGSGASQHDPRVTSNLDPAYLAAAVRASWMGTHNGAEGDYKYWIEKASGAEQFSDGVWRIGWNRYWETRMFQDSGNPKDGDKPAQFQPDGASGGGPVPVPAGAPGAALDATIAALKADLAYLAATVKTQAVEIAALKARPSGGNTTGIVDGAVVALKSHTEGRGYLTAEPSGEVNAAAPDRAFGGYQLFTIELQQ